MEIRDGTARIGEEVDVADRHIGRCIVEGILKNNLPRSSCFWLLIAGVGGVRVGADHVTACWCIAGRESVLVERVSPIPRQNQLPAQ
jgi:hypothetical protein